MPSRCGFLVVVLLAAGQALGQSPHLAFKPAGEASCFEFNTGIFRGRLKLDGKYQGIYPIVDVASGVDFVHAPGLLSFYRALETDHRHGAGVRDWPTRNTLLPDGAVEARFPPATDHPLEIVAVYRWKAADTLDLEITVTPQKAMPQFELFLSSYFTKARHFPASIYLKTDASSPPRFVPIERKPQSTGGYVMFPRDEQAVKIISDGRWKYPPNPVAWEIERTLAAPILIRRDESCGLTGVMMAPPGDCFAMSAPWNVPSATAAGYRAVYLSLFGRDLPAAQPAGARCRLVIGHKLTDDDALRRYEEYVRETK